MFPIGNIKEKRRFFTFLLFMIAWKMKVFKETCEMLIHELVFVKQLVNLLNHVINYPILS